MSEDQEVQHRGWFHRASGGFDLQRMLENAIPMLVIGGVGLYVSVKINEAQVLDMRQEIKDLRSGMAAQARDYFVMNGQLIALNEKVAGYLAQQTQLNAQVDARMTYLERGRR